MPKIIRSKLKAGRLTPICQMLDVKRSTIQSAIDRGEIPVDVTADGCDLIDPVDVKRWLKAERSTGPKAKPKKSS